MTSEALADSSSRATECPCHKSVKDRYVNSVTINRTALLKMHLNF